MFGLSPDQERVRLRLVAAGLPPQSRHTRPLLRAVVARLGGSVKGCLPEEIDQAVELVKSRASGAFDPDQGADPGAGGYREFLARNPQAAGKLTEQQEAHLSRAAEADEQVARLLVDLGVAS